jgi:hypothetical protein
MIELRYVVGGQDIAQNRDYWVMWAATARGWVPKAMTGSGLWPTAGLVNDAVRYLLERYPNEFTLEPAQ